MRTLLRNTTTGFYSEARDKWTSHPEQAFDFTSTERVIRFVRNSQLETNELEVILAFDNPEFNITLPINGRFGISAPAERPASPRLFS